MPLYHFGAVQDDEARRKRIENAKRGRIFPSETRAHIRRALDEGVWYTIPASGDSCSKEKPMKQDKKKKGGKGC